MLKRLYIDRIVDFKGRVDKHLICKKCKTVLGVQIIYQKEHRPAYRLFAGAVGKTVVKGDILPKMKE
ncbi:MAG: hypothetical protein WC477_02625 [Patescibacteria group bacterium]